MDRDRYPWTTRLSLCHQRKGWVVFFPIPMPFLLPIYVRFTTTHSSSCMSSVFPIRKRTNPTATILVPGNVACHDVCPTLVRQSGVTKEHALLNIVVEHPRRRNGYPTPPLTPRYTLTHSCIRSCSGCQCKYAGWPHSPGTVGQHKCL